MTPAASIRRRPLRVQLTRAFALAGLLPFAILVVWGVAHGRQESARARRTLAQAAAHMRVELDEYLEHHRLAILSLSSALEVAGRPATRAGMATWLASVHRRYPGFVSMLATASVGRVVAVTPPDVLGPEGGGDVSDRDYFQVFAWGHARPFVSNAFRGRGTRSMPIVAVSAPVHDAGGRFNHYYYHGYLIPLISLYLVFWNRNKLRNIKNTPAWYGVIFASFGILAFFIDKFLFNELFLSSLSMLIFLTGMVLLAFGKQYLRILLFPIIFLVFMIPIPDFVFNSLIVPLQLLASKLGEIFFESWEFPCIEMGFISI